MESWRDDVASPMKPCPTAGARRCRVFQHADGRRISSRDVAAEGTLGTPEPAQATAEPETEEDAQLRWAAEASMTGKKKMTGDAKKAEDGEKMDAEDAPVTDKEKEDTGRTQHWWRIGTDHLKISTTPRF